MSDFIPLEPVKILKTTGAPKKVLSDEESRHNKYASPRSRYFMFLLYPDNPDHMEVLSWIRDNLHYIAVLHDRDLLDHADDSELGDFSDALSESDFALAKPHYHVLVRFSNCRTINGVRKYFGFLIDKWIQVCSDPYASALYMTHNTFGSVKKKKFRYSLNDVEGTPNLKKRLFSDFSSLFTEQILTRLIEIIERRNCMSLRSLIKYLIVSQQFDLLDYVVSHVYVVNNLLVPSVSVPSDDSPAHEVDSYRAMKKDSQPLCKQRLFKAVDDLLHDSVSTDFPVLVPKNRSQSRKLK